MRTSLTVSLLTLQFASAQYSYGSPYYQDYPHNQYQYEQQTMNNFDQSGCQDNTFKRIPRPGGGYECMKKQAHCSGFYENDHYTGQRNWKCCPEGKFYEHDQNAGAGACCKPHTHLQVNNGKAGCCPPGTRWAYNRNINRGECCGYGHSYSVDMKSNTGFCCPDGKQWNGLSCGDRYMPQQQQHQQYASPPPNRPQYGQQQIHQQQPVYGNMTPLLTNRPWCTEKKVCPSSCNNIGLKYGSCYRMTYPDGTPLNRASNQEYHRGADYIEDITFKVCNTAKDCRKGNYLSKHDGFLLKDLKGVPGQNTPGWMWTGGLYNHIRFVADDGNSMNVQIAGEAVSGIVPFQGKPSCIGDGCSICLNTQIKSAKGLGLVGPVEGNKMPAFGPLENGNMCQRFVFYEVACEDEPCHLDQGVPQGVPCGNQHVQQDSPCGDSQQRVQFEPNMQY